MTSVNHLIQIESIGKDYFCGDTTVNAIKNMDFFIDDGEFISIMGQSGSGKSTLLSILGGLNHPSRVSLACMGSPVNENWLMSNGGSGGRREKPG